MTSEFLVFITYSAALVTSSQCDAVTSFYSLFYEDRCCDLYELRACRLYENGSFSRSSTVCASLVPSRPGHPIKRDPRRAFRRGSSELSISLKSRAPFDRGRFSLRARWKDIKPRVIPVHRFPIQRRAAPAVTMWSAAHRDISRDKIVMFAQQWDASLIIYMHIFSMSVISPIPIGSSVIEHAQNLGLGAFAYWLQIFFASSVDC